MGRPETDGNFLAGTLFLVLGSSHPFSDLLPLQYSCKPSTLVPFLIEISAHFPAYFAPLHLTLNLRKRLSCA